MKRTTAIALCLCVILSLTPGFAADISDFTDVSTGDWYYADAQYVVSHGMVTGITPTQFGPNYTMTRGMFVTLLGRYAGETGTVPSDESTQGESQYGNITASDVNMRSAPTTNSTVLACLAKNTRVQILDIVSGTDDGRYKWYKVLYSGKEGYIREDLMKPATDEGSGVLSDVPSDSYYAPYVYWALEKGIGEKTGSDTFSPEDPITREEICYMLFNYAKVKYYTLPVTAAAVTFSDDSMISASRKEAVSAMQLSGIVGGYPDGSFKPRNSASRAEVSASVVRFINAIAYKPDTASSVDSNGNYIWGRPMPEGITMNSSYLNDACFIGHSIVNGMEAYFGLDQTDFYAVNSATTSSIVTYDKFKFPVPFEDEDGQVRETGTLSEVLGTKNYGKVYIMLGTNEIGMSKNTFYSNLASIVDMVRSLQPAAKVYLFAITPVTKTCSENSDYFHRDVIIDFNKTIQSLCADKKCYYLDVFGLLVDSDGFAPEDSCMSDGIHLLRPAYVSMKNYVLSHAV